MDESKEGVQLSDATVEQAYGITKPEAYVSSAQNVADKIEQKLFGESKPEAEKESVESDEVSEDVEESVESEDSEDVEEAEDDDTEEESEESEFGKDSTKKGKDEEDAEEVDPYKKRIGKLKYEKQKEREEKEAAIALNKKLEERLEQLEKVYKKEQDTKPKDRVFTDEELTIAMRKFMDEGDANGVLDVINYKNEQAKKDLLKMYEEEKNAQKQAVDSVKNEWQTISEEYSPEAYDNPVLSKNPDFDINNQNGLLFKVAKAFYEDKKLAPIYSGKGGMKKAVQDAFNEILIQMSTSKLKKDTGVIKDSSKKKDRKSSLGAGADDAGIVSTTPKQFNPNDDLAEVLYERKKFRDSRMTTGV